MTSTNFTKFVAVFISSLAFLIGSFAASAQESTKTYDEDTMFDAAEGFFGDTAAGLAEVMHKVFSDQGEPEAYIAGEEVSAAIGVGLRYGHGLLYRPGAEPVKVYWRGPSVGFDAGGNASKSFTLIYHMGSTDNLFHRYPGVDGSYYFIGGVGVNYQQRGDTILAPIRTGVGLRAGVNIGYLKYRRKKGWIPL